MGLEVSALRIRLANLQIEVDLKVADGERLVLSGPSGSGKTTVFRFVAGLLEPGISTAGRVLLAGRELGSLPPEKRELGVVFQDPLVFPHLSVIENAAFGLRMRGISGEERRAKVEPWLERVGLAGRRDADPETLSGGERQRLALVRAMVWGPSALLLDEPFSALDPGLRSELGAMVVELHQKLTIPLMLVTHDEDEAVRIGTRISRCQVLSGSPPRHIWLENR